MDFLNAFDFNAQTSLYIHVPFCKSKCSYCAFYSKHCNSSEIDNYFSRIVLELDSLLSNMNGKAFYTAYIGGGNPGCLSVEQLKVLCSKICTFGRPMEFTIEMNPESLTKEHFELFDKYLNRISMGIQSLDFNALKFLGRNASLDETLNGMSLALELRKQTGCKLSFDLISCLPYWHDYMNDVKAVVGGYKPDHISVYALTLEEDTPLYKTAPNLPTSDEQFCILSDIWEYLDSTGYKQYEVSNFALDGCESLHNSVYWDYKQYIGLGPAAASTGFQNGKVFRVESPYSVENYGANQPFSDYKIIPLSANESLEEFVLMGLRHTKGLDMQRLAGEFNFELKNIPQGFTVKDNFLCPDKNGLMTADWAASYVLGLY